jgi:serine/threonine-protein kinase
VHPQDSHIGRKYGEFTVLERIGHGGAATVYRAHQQSFNRDVALKIIDFSVNDARYEEFKRRFAREAEFIATLEHIHILPVYAYGIEDHMAYLAMRLLRGGSLKDLLASGQPLEPQRAISLFRQVADGLAYAHSRSVIHRDLKPGNVMLDTEGNAYLTDFGLAKIISGDGDLTQQGMVVGTLLYMSPEQLRGERLDQRADIYSMGIMLYEMLAGRHPFPPEVSEDAGATIYHHLEGVHPALHSVNPLVPLPLDVAVMKALSRSPADRYEDMEAFVRAINNAVGITDTVQFPKVSPMLVETDVSAQPDEKRKAVRRRAMAATGALAAAAILIAGALAVVGPRLSAPQPYTILAGERINWDDLSPSTAQISAAQARLNGSFVALVACNSTSEYHSTLTRETGVLLRQAGLDFRVYDSENDEYLQRLHMERALTEGAGAFILCPLSYNVINNPLRAINEQKLPVVAYNNPDNNATYDIVYTASDNTNADMGRAVGLAAGAFIRDKRDGEARVILLDFPDMQAIVERADGIESGIAEVAPTARIIGRYLGGTRDNGYASVSRLLSEGVTFDVIASINDAGAIGAVRALEEASIPYDAVAIFSVDAEEQAINYMRRGQYFQGTLEVGRAQTAESTVNVIIRMLAGDTVPQIIYIPLLDLLTPADLEP